MSSFKISNTNIDENEKIIDANTKLGQLFAGFMMLQGAVDELQGGGGGGGGSVRNVLVIDGGGGAGVNTLANGSLVYSLNQSPGQLLIDSNGENQSPSIGTEYIIYAGANNTVYLQTSKTNGRIQISGTATNTTNADVTIAINSKCTITKITATLWIAQGDGLAYIS